MNWLDYSIVILYIAFFLGMGFFFKENKDSKDYFLGGKSMSWFPLSLSTMATQLSAISFISAPAFVGLKLGGGMKWLTFEFAVPLAMIFIMIVIIPPLFKSGVVSIYEFVEKRFSASTRLILSIVFTAFTSVMFSQSVFDKYEDKDDVSDNGVVRLQWNSANEVEFQWCPGEKAKAGQRGHQPPHVSAKLKR